MEARQPAQPGEGAAFDALIRRLDKERMRQEPELLVPISEALEAARPAPLPEVRLPRWAVILTRIWVVLALVVAWVVFTSGSRELQWKGAGYALGGFVLVWHVAVWIFGPTLPPNDERR